MYYIFLILYCEAFCLIIQKQVLKLNVITLQVIQISLFPESKKYN